MKKLLVASIAAAAFCCAPVLAADMPVKGPTYRAPVAAPVYSWTGCYIGLQGGYGTANTKGINTNTNVTEFLPYDYDADGGLIGGHIGCDYQYHPSFVVGIEGDWSWANLSGRQTGITDPVNDPGVFFTHTTKISDIATVRARLGMLSDPATLWYATGGWASVKAKYNFGFDGAAPALTHSETRNGWTVGAGVERYFAPNWTARLEYRYVRFGGGTLHPPLNVIENLDPTHVHEVLVGLTWRFGGGKGPVSAKY
jgi:outer membrane immunogenic protein